MLQQGWKILLGFQEINHGKYRSYDFKWNRSNPELEILLRYLMNYQELEILLLVIMKYKGNLLKRIIT